MKREWTSAGKKYTFCRNVERASGNFPRRPPR